MTRQKCKVCRRSLDSYHSTFCQSCARSWQDMYEGNYGDVDAMQAALWAAGRANYFANRKPGKKTK